MSFDDKPPQMEEEKPDDSIFQSTISPTPMNNFGEDDEESPFGDNNTDFKSESVMTNTVSVGNVDSYPSLHEETTTNNTNQVDVDLNVTTQSTIPSYFTPTFTEVATNVAQTASNIYSTETIESQSTTNNASTSNAASPTQSNPSWLSNDESKSSDIFTTTSTETKPVWPSNSDSRTTEVLKSPSTEPKPVWTPTNENRTTDVIKPVQKTKRDITIVVNEPTKIGDGMSSYMSYRILTKTTLPQFKDGEFSVSRRFSDFLGLHIKLVHKYLKEGLIMPAPPEKDSMSMAKVKMSQTDSSATNFLEHRRSYLERYLNRLVQHPKLLEDSDVREFIESSQNLPKSTNTQAVSADGVLRAFSFLSDQVSKLAQKKSEQDQWFEDKFVNLMEIQKRLKNFYSRMNNLHHDRKEGAKALQNLSVFLNYLASVEEHGLVANALTELANLQDKIEQIQNERAAKEYAILTELIKEYIYIFDMVEMAFRARIRLHQHWLACEDNLTKKRENKVKLENNPKSVNKLPQAEMEIHEWEGKTAQAKQDFENICTTLKFEIEVFDGTRLDDFKNAIHQYLNNQLELHERILNIWEHFIPEAQKINI